MSARRVKDLRPREAVMLTGKETVTEACILMHKANSDSALIVEPDGELTGIITDTDAVRCIAECMDPDSVRVFAVCTKNPHCVREQDDAVEALCKMVEKRIRHLPVIAKSGAVSGVLDIAKCLYDAIARLERYISSASSKLSGAVMNTLPSRRAGDLETSAQDVVDSLVSKLFAPSLSDVLGSLGHGKEPLATGSTRVTASLSLTASVQEAAQLMMAHRGAILVHSDDESCAGILTSKDLMFRFVAASRHASTTEVSQIMTRKPDCMDASSTVLQALHQLQYGGYRHVPIVSSAGAPMGVLDVLALVEAGIACHQSPQSETLASAGRLSSNTNDWREFWGSAESLIGQPAYQGSADGKSEAQSEGLSSKSVSRNEGGRDAVSGTDGSLSDARTATQMFLFKIVDPRAGGQMHRLHHAADSLASLREAVSSTIGLNPDDASRLALQYEDDDSDRVCITADAELAEAVQIIRRAGRDRMVLHASIASVQQKQTPVITPKAALSNQERVFLLGSAAALSAIVVTVRSLAGR